MLVCYYLNWGISHCVKKMLHKMPTANAQKFHQKIPTAQAYKTDSFLLTVRYCYTCSEAQKLLVLVNQRSKCCTKWGRRITMLHTQNWWMELCICSKLEPETVTSSPSEFLLYIEEGIDWHLHTVILTP